MTIERLAQFTAETRVLTDLTYITSALTGLPAISSVQAKTGTYSYRVTTAHGAFGKVLSAGISAARFGYWQYMDEISIDSLTSTGGTLLYFAGNARSPSVTNSNLHIVFDIGPGNLLLRRPSGNQIGDYQDIADAPIPSQYSTSGSWFHVGITHKIAEVDGFVSVYINGVSVLQYVGDTRLAQGVDIDTVSFADTATHFMGPGAFGNGGAGFEDIFVDDMYLDSYVSEADAPVPSRRFLMVLPTAAGEDADWTAVPAVANYLNVDDNPNDGDTTYNKALTADLRDTFVMGDVTLPVDHRIVAVLPTPFVKRLDSEIQHELSVHAWDGLQYGDSADLELSMSYDVPVFARLTQQPDGSDWNEADFNNMQFGYRSRGDF